MAFGLSGDNSHRANQQISKSANQQISKSQISKSQIADLLIC
jgi:hypothetical protein